MYTINPRKEKRARLVKKIVYYSVITFYALPFALGIYVLVYLAGLAELPPIN